MEISAAAGRVGGAAAVQRTEAAVARSGEAAEQAGTAAPPREPAPPYGIASASEARGVPAEALVEAAAPFAAERPADVRETAARDGVGEVERGRDAGEAGRSERAETPGQKE